MKYPIRYYDVFDYFLHGVPLEVGDIVWDKHDECMRTVRSRSPVREKNMPPETWAIIHYVEENQWRFSWGKPESELVE